MMKVVLLQVWEGSREPVLRPLCRNRGFARRYGWSYQLCRRRRTPGDDPADPAWARLQFIMELLVQSAVMTVVYLDADVQITDHRQAGRLEALTRVCGARAELILTTDDELVRSLKRGRRGHGCCLATARPCTCLINTGLMVIRSTTWTRSFFSALLRSEHCALYRNERQWDQVRGDVPAKYS
jgi:hypothetical protein